MNLVPQIEERAHLHNPSNVEVGMGLIFYKKKKKFHQEWGVGESRHTTFDLKFLI